MINEYNQQQNQLIVMWVDNCAFQTGEENNTIMELAEGPQPQDKGAVYCRLRELPVRFVLSDERGSGPTVFDSITDVTNHKFGGPREGLFLTPPYRAIVAASTRVVWILDRLEIIVVDGQRRTIDALAECRLQALCRTFLADEPQQHLVILLSQLGVPNTRAAADRVAGNVGVDPKQIRVFSPNEWRRLIGDVKAFIHQP